jgi:hypothetical protein
MKFKIYFTLLAFVALFGCTGSSGLSSSDVPEDQPTLERAAFTAQDFIKSLFSSDCDFDDLDIRGEETSVHGRYEVFQKFTSSKSGSEREYVYKIFIQHFGGDWTDKSNWDYGTLTIEDVATGQQEVFKGSMKDREVSAAAEPGTMVVNGIQFNVVEQTAQYVRLSTPEQLSHEDLISVARSIDGDGNVFFCTDGHTARGEEYAAKTGNNLFDYTGHSESIVKLK